jgi:hypothetical protein
MSARYPHWRPTTKLLRQAVFLLFSNHCCQQSVGRSRAAVPQQCRPVTRCESGPPACCWGWYTAHTHSSHSHAEVPAARGALQVLWARRPSLACSPLPLSTRPARRDWRSVFFQVPLLGLCEKRGRTTALCLPTGAPHERRQPRPTPFSCHKVSDGRARCQTAPAARLRPTFRGFWRGGWCALLPC